jgi:hypothetical protein
VEEIAKKNREAMAVETSWQTKTLKREFYRIGGLGAQFKKKNDNSSEGEKEPEWLGKGMSN